MGIVVAHALAAQRRDRLGKSALARRFLVRVLPRQSAIGRLPVADESRGALPFGGNEDPELALA